MLVNKTPCCLGLRPTGFGRKIKIYGFLVGNGQNGHTLVQVLRCKGVRMVELSANEYYAIDAPAEVTKSRAKRVFDVVTALMLLVFLAPLFVAVSIAVAIETRGPVFFRQRRTGFNQQTFFIYKFRTMTVMEDGDNVIQAQKYDDRVTRVGAFLRRSSIDELPQLINVLRGEMSIIGPRPHAVVHDEDYSRQLDEYCKRFRAKPGITGWAQVNGLRGQTEELDEMRQRIQYDNHYIDHWDLGFDATIFAMTLLVLPFQKSAY